MTRTEEEEEIYQLGARRYYKRGMRRGKKIQKEKDELELSLTDEQRKALLTLKDACEVLSGV